MKTKTDKKDETETQSKGTNYATKTEAELQRRRWLKKSKVELIPPLGNLLDSTKPATPMLPD